MGLINHCAPLSTSEVGLNFGSEAGSTGAFGPDWWHQPGLKGGHWYRLVPPTGTKGRPFLPFGLLKRGLWSRLVAPTETKGVHWYRFVALTGTNAPPLVPIGDTNRDQRPPLPAL